MIQATNICPLCDKLSNADVYPAKKGEKLPKWNGQPYRILCDHCDPNYTGSVGVYGFINKQILSTDKASTEWGFQMYEADKFDLGPSAGVPQIPDEEVLLLWLSTPSLPASNCLFFRRPGHFLHAWEYEGIIRCRFAVYDPYGSCFFFCPTQLAINTEQITFSHEDWFASVDIEDEEKSAMMVATELADVLWLMSNPETDFSMEGLELANEKLVQREKEAVTPFYPFVSVHYPVRNLLGE